MKILINNLSLALDEDGSVLKRRAAKLLKIPEAAIVGFTVLKESVDARKKADIRLIYSVEVETAGTIKMPDDPSVRLTEDTPEEPARGTEPLRYRPVVVGMGPAGLFAALLLARNGYRPIVLERGDEVSKRSAAVKSYWEGGELDTESNVQFGEGGAGTFSDGKLTTRIHDRRCSDVLKELHRAGAPGEILYKAKPHIGSGNLRRVVAEIRKSIIALGGEVRFRTKLTSLEVRDRRVTGITVNGTERLDADAVVLAVGHSARDTFEALLANGVTFAQKPFSIGVRIEHPQSLIDRSQYGPNAGHPKLGPAEYGHFYKTASRTAYSFCMCPGGTVVAAASERGMICTNGMSEFARDRENANSAFVVSVEPSDFGSSHPLAGVEFNRLWERAAFRIAGADGSAPVQRLEDFLEGRVTKKFGTVRPSYTGNTRCADLHACLPPFVTGAMKEALASFDRKIGGFALPDAVMTGVETRTSSPVRIPRGESFEAEGLGGLYPAGEGAGYAGGIMSAAVDGMRVAERIMTRFAPADSFGDVRFP